MQPPTIEAALRDVNSAKPRFRRDAAEALGRADGDDTARARDALGRLLGDADRSVRVAAAESLGAVGDDSDLDALVRLADDSDEAVRIAAVEAAASVAADPDAALIRLADHASPDVRITACIELRASSEEAAAEALLRRLRDGDARVRAAVVASLCAALPSRHAGAVRAMLSDDDPDVRLAAACGLASARDDSGRNLLLDRVPRRPRDDTWRAALPALARVAHPDDAPVLRRFAGWLPPRGIRAVALAGLARLGDAAAEARLRRMAGHRDPRRRASALLGAGVAGLESFLPEIERDLREPRSALFDVALHALVELRTPAAARTLVAVARELKTAGKDGEGVAEYFADAAAAMARSLGDDAPAELIDLAKC
ncbi:MAG: HEAT repeat domain-containing protein [Myxococcota bacterium]|nr:HEAT repeat domain-containing protein [Myxococcota bacterium]